MNRQAVIVISIAKDSWASEGILKKLLGDAQSSYVFDKEAYSEIAALATNADGDFAKHASAGEDDHPSLFLAAAHRLKEDDLSEVIIGRCAVVKNENGDYLMPVRDTVRLERSRSPLPVKNIYRMLSLDLNDNYADTGYTRIEFSNRARECVEFYLADNRTGGHAISAAEIASSRPTVPRRLVAESEACANCFSLDYERIVQSKAFRRMVDKAQVFTSSKGDHYRTRMTHTLEVARVSRALARRLKADSDLVEAIALAHDIGHTPFGHQGERSLNDILRGRALEELGLLSESGKPSDNPYGGFKHNFQSVRVLSALEERFPGFNGSNLSAQVLEGALWHTKAPMKKECGECKGKKDVCCDKESYRHSPKAAAKGESHDFWNFVFHDGDYKGIERSLTYEGQIVAIADEIAQRGHDIEDALTAELITVDELLDLCKIRSVKGLHDVLKEVDLAIESVQSEGKMLIDRQRLRKDALSRRIVEYLIDSVANGTKDVSSSSCTDTVYGPLFKEQIVKFDNSGKEICAYLEKVVTSSVLASQEVSRFDNKGRMIIEGLFKAYYLQPRLLPETSLRRIALVERQDGCPAALDLSNCDFGIGKEEIRNIQSADIADLISFRKRGKRQMTEKEEWAFKKKILVRCIADHISGMTDSYAATEYERIYGTRL